MINNNQNKKSIMILIVGIVLLFFNNLPLFSQDKSILDSAISYRAKNISLHEGLTEIGDIVGLEFSYNSDLVPSDNKIKVNFNNTPLRSLLTDLLNDTTLTFRILDKQIVISKRKQINQLVAINGFTESRNFLQINGGVYDKLNGEPLAFANVAVLGKSIGTVSNENGNFNLKISVENLLDTLAISYIGYSNTIIPIKELSIYSNKIYLTVDHFQIEEVVIRSNNPLIIMKEALEKVKNNYFTDPYYMTSFYREIINKDDDLAAITEAVLKVYKSPYLGLYSDQVKLIKSRKNEYYSKADTVSLKLKGGLYASLYLDVIKNPMYFLIEGHFDKFTYRIENIVNFNNGTAYEISFTPKIYMDENSFEGKMYIDTDNLAIIKVNFNIVPEAIERMGNNLVVKKSFRTRVKPVSVKYIINYRKIGNKYFLNLARGELDFRVKHKGKLFSRDFKTVFELAANDIDTVDVERFNRIETISQHNIFIDENYQYDHLFWGGYNFISPDESLEEALIRIKKQLENIED